MAGERRAELIWVDDEAGYRCPQCGIYVCIPQRDSASCPSGCVMAGETSDRDDPPSELLRIVERHHGDCMYPEDFYPELSSWLAGHDREVRAAALRQAAVDMDLPGPDAYEHYSLEHYAGYREAARDAEAWLHARALGVSGE